MSAATCMNTARPSLIAALIVAVMLAIAVVIG